MELMPVKFDQVLIHCSDSDSVLVHWHSALLAWQAQMTYHHTKQKNYGLHRIAHVHNIVHVNCCTCTYIFPKQNGGSCKNFYGMHFVFIFSLTLCPIVVEQSCMEWSQVKKKILHLKLSEFTHGEDDILLEDQETYCFIYYNNLVLTVATFW